MDNSNPKKKKISNVYRDKKIPYWFFSKEDNISGKRFYKSTKIINTENNKAAARKKGLELYDDWLRQGSPLKGKIVTIKDIADLVYTSHSHQRATTVAAYKYHLYKRIVPAFGNLRPDQLTSLKWNSYVSSEIRLGRNTVFKKTLQILREVLDRSEEEGLIERIPNLTVDDRETAPPLYLTNDQVLKLIASVSRQKKRRALKLLLLIMWKQGARPREALKYKFSMVDWDKGTISIPGEITKTKRSREIPINSSVFRVLKILYKNADSDFIFPSPRNPNEPMTEYKTAWTSARKKAGIDCIIYNLRDTFITNALKHSSATNIGLYCDTSGTMIETHYAVPLFEVLKGVAG